MKFEQHNRVACDVIEFVCVSSIADVLGGYTDDDILVVQPKEVAAPPPPAKRDIIQVRHSSGAEAVEVHARRGARLLLYSFS